MSTLRDDILALCDLYFYRLLNENVPKVEDIAVEIARLASTCNSSDYTFTLRVAITLGNAARTDIRLNSVAIEYLERILEPQFASENQDYPDITIPRIVITLAELYLLQGNSNQGQKYYSLALAEEHHYIRAEIKRVKRLLDESE